MTVARFLPVVVRYVRDTHIALPSCTSILYLENQHKLPSLEVVGKLSLQSVMFDSAILDMMMSQLQSYCCNSNCLLKQCWWLTRQAEGS